MDKTTRNALAVLELAGRADVPVAQGADRPLVGELVVAADAHGESGLGRLDLPAPRAAPVDGNAVDFLAERLAISDSPLTLVPLGPLTNIGLLLLKHPDAAEKVERIVLMGGAIGEGNMTASAEFNVWTDPEAAFNVFESGLDVTMVGLDVTNRAVLGPGDADRLRDAGRVGAAVAEMLDFYLSFYLETYDHGGAPIHDALAIAHLIRPDLVTTLDRRVDVELGAGLCRGRTVVDMRRRHAGPEPNAHVAVDVDVPAFRELLVGRLANFPAASASDALKAR